MLTETELKIISYLRNNSRQSGSLLARKIGIPASTLFDKLHSCEKRFVRKHTSLLDFDKLGFSARVQIVLKVPEESKAIIQDFLLNHGSVNSFYKVNNGFDFLVECIFKNRSEAKDFVEYLQKSFGIIDFCTFDVLEELRREEFLSCLENSKS